MGTQLPPLPGMRPELYPAGMSDDVLRTHIAYISAEMADVSRKLDALSSTMSSMMQNMPMTYASTQGVQQLAQRVDTLETRWDQNLHILQQVEKIAKEVDGIHSWKDQMTGGQRWLWAALGAVSTVFGVLLGIVGLKGVLW